MQMQATKKDDKICDHIMLGFIGGVGLSGWAFVMLFLQGGKEECIFPITTALAFITWLLRKPLGGLTKLHIRVYSAYLGRGYASCLRQHRKSGICVHNSLLYCGNTFACSLL